MGALMNFFVQLLQIFCLGNGKQNQNQQQQHQYPQQGQQGGAWQGGQQGGAWQGQQGQQGGQSYPPTTSGGWTSVRLPLILQSTCLSDIRGIASQVDTDD